MTNASRLRFLLFVARFSKPGELKLRFGKPGYEKTESFLDRFQEHFLMINDHEKWESPGNVDLPNFPSVLRVLCAFAVKSLQRTAQFEY